MKFTKNKIIILIAIIIFVIFEITFVFKNKYLILLPTPQLLNQNQKLNPKLLQIKIKNVVMEVILAETPQEQEIGLSGKNSLADNQGMLFVFKKPGFYYFWMKDMKFPIDIIWIDENFKIIEITKNVHPESYPQLFQSTRPALYVIETNAGFSDLKNINPGDIVDLSEIFSTQNKSINNK
jgi:uncharacterized membrane protein (UPF0127 family)